MTAINFKLKFVPLVQSGAKTHTIRKQRRHPIKAGDTLQLYTGMRTKQCRKIVEDRTCTKVESIIIDRLRNKVIIGDAHLDAGEIEQFAKADGFENSNQFFFFFAQYPDEDLSTKMVVIHWS